MTFSGYETIFTFNLYTNARSLLTLKDYRYLVAGDVFACSVMVGWVLIIRLLVQINHFLEIVNVDDV